MARNDIPVEGLIQQLHGSDWTARCDAARLLGQSRDPRAVDALLPDLNDRDWRVRRNAAQALGALRDQRAVEPLLRSLNDRTATVRQRAMVALGRIKDPRALPPLLHILLDDKHAEYEAYQAIRKFGNRAIPEVVRAYENSDHPRLMMLLIEMKYEGAADLLLKLLDSPEPATRWMAIRELGKLENKRVTQHLVQQLKEDDPITHSEVVRALGKLGASETIPTLLGLLTDDDLYGPRSAIYHAIAEAFQHFAGITKQLEKAFPGEYPPMFSASGAPISLPEAMSLMGNRQFQSVNDMLSTMERRANTVAQDAGLPADILKKAVERTAWKFGVMIADARDASQERTKYLIELLGSGSSLARAAAALSLPWYTDEKSMGPLKQATEGDDEIVRKAATWGLAALQKVLAYRAGPGK